MNGTVTVWDRGGVPHVCVTDEEYRDAAREVFGLELEEISREDGGSLADSCPNPQHRKGEM